MSANWSDWRVAKRMGLPATMPTIAAPVTPQPARPQFSGLVRPTSLQVTLLTRRGLAVPATMNEAAALLAAYGRPAPRDAIDARWDELMAAIPDVGV